MTETRKVYRAYNLYQALGSLPAGAQVYVDTQDNHAYRVIELERDAAGDIILKTVPQDQGSGREALRKHS